MSNSIKIACSTWMLPGDTFHEKMETALAYGYEGVELRLFEQDTTKEDVQDIINTFKSTGVKPSSLLFTGDALRKTLNSAEVLKEKCAHAERALQLAAQFDCPALICPECGPQNPLPMFNHPKRPTQQEQDMVLEYVRHTDEYATKTGARALIEPINRYETHFWYSLDDAAETLDAVNARSVGLLADFFHMSLEESDIPAALRKHGHRLRHVHLGDNNRMLPGQGYTDFISGIRVLQEIGYTGFMALECGIKGETAEQLPACAKRLKDWIG